MKTLNQLLNEGLLPSSTDIKTNFLKSFAKTHLSGDYGFSRGSDTTILLQPNDKFEIKNVNKQTMGVLCNNNVVIKHDGRAFWDILGMFDIKFNNCFISADILTNLFDANHLVNYGECDNYIKGFNVTFENCNFENGVLDLSDYPLFIYDMKIIGGNIKTLKWSTKQKRYYDKRYSNLIIKGCSNLSSIYNVRDDYNAGSSTQMNYDFDIEDCPALKTIKNCGIPPDSMSFKNVGIEEIRFDGKMFDKFENFKSRYGISRYNFNNCNKLRYLEIPFNETSKTNITNCKQLKELKFTDNPIYHQYDKGELFLIDCPSLEIINNPPTFAIDSAESKGCTKFNNKYKIVKFYKKYKLKVLE